MTTQPQFYTLLFTTSSLAMNPSLLSSLKDLCNTAMYEHENFDAAPRFAQDNEVLSELGDNGLCAVAFCPVEGATRDLPVACIMAKEYDPPKIEGDENVSDALLEISQNIPHSNKNSDSTSQPYRLYGVSTLSSSLYRGKGLIPLCLQALKSALPSSPLWIETAEETNGPYWRRRGFKEVSRVKKAAGFWAAKREFEWVLLRD